ncbi:hypothetical protein C3L33_19381, partial [Rhododendron williamsianum]
MNGHRYRYDSGVVAVDASAFAETVNVSGDGMDAWVFDIDETLLSNLPYYATVRYGFMPSILCVLVELVTVCLLICDLNGHDINLVGSVYRISMPEEQCKPGLASNQAALGV